MQLTHHRRAATLLFAAGTLALIAGCTAGGEDASSTGGTMAARSFEAVVMPSGSAGAIPTELLGALIADAASDAGVDASQVEVITAESVTWNDGSLGCPEPGMSYTQALVPGYRVVLDIDGEQLHFHSDSSGEFRHCEDPLPGAAGDGSR
jgi:hypothetical protein